MTKGRGYADKGRWIENTLFRVQKLQEAAGNGKFDTSQDKTTPPTLILNDVQVPLTFWLGKIMRIHYRIKPTNAVTYTLRIWSGTSAAGNYTLNTKLLYESPALQASDTDYDRLVTVPFMLDTVGTIYYSLEWTGATGNVQGFIDVEGEPYR